MPLSTLDTHLPKQILDALKIIFPSVCNDFEADLVEFDGEKYHVHLLITYPPKVSISRSVNSLKGVSSRLIRKKKYLSIPSLLWGMLSGLLLILLQVVGVHLFLLSNSTLNNRIRLTEKIIIFDPYITVLKDGVLRAGLIKKAWLPPSVTIAFQYFNNSKIF